MQMVAYEAYLKSAEGADSEGQERLAEEVLAHFSSLLQH